MAIPTTDLMYNNDSREIQLRYDIYFRENMAPLVVNRDNYLISSTGLDEAYTDSGDALGTVSSNEITLEILNESSMFTPTNPSSPYYGYIKKGVRIEAYGRVLVDSTETAWDSLGTYYVTEWSTTSSGLLASVTANDKLYNVFEAPRPIIPVSKGVPVKDFFKQYFNSVGLPVSVDDSIRDTLTYAFINQDNKEFLSDLANGTLTMCYINRRGDAAVLNRLNTKALRATITDNDQIIEVSTKQDLKTGYDGASVVCNSPYESNVVEIVVLNEQTLPVGTSTLTALALSVSPMIRVCYATVLGNANVRIKKITSTPTHCELVVENLSDGPVTVDISVYGKALEYTSLADADGGTNLLALDSQYVQTKEQSDRCKKYLKRWVGNKDATLSVRVRGNLKLQIGDKIRVVSTRYATDFTGIIIRSEYEYNGGLNGTLTLLDAALFGEVQ